MPNEFIRLMAEERTFTLDGPLKSITFELFGREVVIAETVVTQWVVMLILGVAFFILGRNLKVVPTTRRQMIAEFIVNTFTGMSDDFVGVKRKIFRPYAGALFCFICLSSLMGLLGLKNPTSDISVTGTLALMTFAMITYTKFKTGGFKGYFKSFTEPVFVMTPMNIISEVATPVSLALRLFGNNLSGIVIGGLLYFALGGLLGGFASIGIPAIVSLYFDLICSFIQAFIFTSLTLCYIANADLSE